MKKLAFSGLVLGLAFLALAMAEPVRTAVQIGMDENYEVTKALLWSQGFPLYRQVWNDQPPLHTVLLGLCFKGFGASIGVARTLAVFFGFSLLTACGLIIRKRAGAGAATVALVCLITAPEVLDLSTSAMLEVPAIGVALWSLWPLLRWEDERRRSWLLLSGALFAVALQIKLTAVVALPALLAEVVAGSMASNRGRWSNQVGQALSLWIGSAAGVFLGLAAALGTVPLGVLWASHFASSTLAHAACQMSLREELGLWFGSADVACGFGCGLICFWWRRDWRRLAFPLIWLLTAMLIHWRHRPWWPYYSLHIIVPLAWLSGYGIAELFRVAWPQIGNRDWKSRLVVLSCLGASWISLGLLGAEGGERLIAEVERIVDLPRVCDDVIVAKLKENADRTRWVFTRETIYPFHARLRAVPELAVLPAKRFWSGQMTEERLWQSVKRYQPEQLLLPAGPLDRICQDFVNKEYNLTYQNGVYAIYVANSLASKR